MNEEDGKCYKDTRCLCCFLLLSPRHGIIPALYAPYLLLWHQNVENQVQIQELQKQSGDLQVAVEGLQKNLNSITQLQPRLQEL